MAEKNYVKVGGQLQNIVGDGILAYSKEIKDEVREKTQEQINTETYEKVAEIDEALSSLSPEQGEALALSERVGQLEKEVGYYECSTSSGTATKHVVADGYALSSGCSIKVKMSNKNTAASNVMLKIGSSEAKPLYYAGKLVSAANTWDAGEVLDIYYNPNNGGAYYANNVEGGSADGVFDVSDYNKSGDPLEPTKYIDLAAALGTNGNNIPENHRKGGMLIKFIELESLEYKQYRYMGTAVSGTSFTNTANWQGADSVPTEDSKNLVESGGVYEECVEAGDPVGDPVGDWVPSEAEAYVDQKVAEERARAIARENQLLKVYETFTQSNLVIGALPATGKVNTIYRVPGTNSYADYMYAASDLHTPILMATYNNDIDEIPTAGSQNLVKSGGVAREIVWDVTARNSNTTFASLNALLSDANLATLIPTTIRRGGMQIRFVLSSDNKYVQYFLTKNQWSTSESDWEKVNLEKEVKSILEYETKIPIQSTDPNHFLKADGSLSSPYSAYSIDYYSVTDLTKEYKFTSKLTASGTLYVVHYYNGDTWLGREYAISSGTTDYSGTLHIPAGTTTIAINRNAADSTSLYYNAVFEGSIAEAVNKLIAEAVNKLQGDVSGLKSDVTGIQADIEDIQEQLPSADNNNFVVMGDSITWLGGVNCDQARGWAKWFKDKFKPKSIKSYAWSGATWTNTVNTVATNTEISVLDDNNTIWQQIRRIIADVNNDVQVTPDVVIIAAGVNDVIAKHYTATGESSPSDHRPNLLDKTAAQAFSDQSTYITSASVQTIVTLADSVRYGCEMLIQAFPSVQIILMTPLQTSYLSSSNQTTLDSVRQIIKDCAAYLSANVIEQNKVCGVYYTQEYPASGSSANHHNLADGLHPTEIGAKKIGSIVASIVKSMVV